MTDKQIYQIFTESSNYENPDDFASDAALSLLGQEDPDQEINMILYDQLRTLWSVRNGPFRALLERMGLNQSQCATRFCIPLRTVQGWALGERVCPPYIRLMMVELTKLLNLR